MRYNDEQLYKNPDQILALSGAHILVRVGGLNINNKYIKCLACYIFILTVKRVREMGRKWNGQARASCIDGQEMTRVVFKGKL